MCCSGCVVLRFGVGTRRQHITLDMCAHTAARVRSLLSSVRACQRKYRV
jgi:hypothetical protein